MFDSAGEHDLKATQICTMSMSKSSGCDSALEIANWKFFTPKSVEWYGPPLIAGFWAHLVEIIRTTTPPWMHPSPREDLDLFDAGDCILSPLHGVHHLQNRYNLFARLFAVVFFIIWFAGLVVSRYIRYTVYVWNNDDVRSSDFIYIFQVVQLS